MPTSSPSPSPSSVITTSTGGNFTCHHGIDTSDVNEWNEHCSDPKNNHMDSGTTACIGCGEPLAFENIPYHKIDRAGSKNIQLRCDECEDTMKESRTKGAVRKVNKNPAAAAAQGQQQQQLQQPDRKPPQ